MRPWSLQMRQEEKLNWAQFQKYLWLVDSTLQKMVPRNRRLTSLARTKVRFTFLMAVNFFCLIRKEFKGPRFLRKSEAGNWRWAWVALIYPAHLNHTPGLRPYRANPHLPAEVADFFQLWPKWCLNVHLKEAVLNIKPLQDLKNPGIYELFLGKDPNTLVFDQPIK